MKNENKEEVAYIESAVTDQGNGGSWCSSCEYDLTHKDWPNKCPQCGKTLIINPNVWMNLGGSDF